MRRSSAGFTLIELLITVGVLGIALAVAMPAFRSFRDSLARSQARSQLIADLRSARQTSVTRHRSVIVAFGNGSATTNITSYTLHTDLNGDQVQQPGEPVSFHALPAPARISNLAITSSPAHPTKLIFDTSGLLIPGYSGGRLVVAGGNGRPDTLDVSAVGMVYRP